MRIGDLTPPTASDQFDRLRYSEYESSESFASEAISNRSYVKVSGELTLIMEDGSEELLSEPGSIVVQRGSLHRWENRSGDWTRYVCVLIDAKAVEVTDKEGIRKTLPEEFHP